MRPAHTTAARRAKSWRARKRTVRAYEQNVTGIGGFSRRRRRLRDAHAHACTHTYAHGHTHARTITQERARSHARRHTRTHTLTVTLGLALRWPTQLHSCARHRQRRCSSLTHGHHAADADLGLRRCPTTMHDMQHTACRQRTCHATCRRSSMPRPMPMPRRVCIPRGCGPRSRICFALCFSTWAVDAAAAATTNGTAE
jgi:hypothetical protein